MLGKAALLGPDPPRTLGLGGALSCINHFRANNPPKPSPNLPLVAQEEGRARYRVWLST